MITLFVAPFKSFSLSSAMHSQYLLGQHYIRASIGTGTFYFCYLSETSLMLFLVKGE